MLIFLRIISRAFALLALFASMLYTMHPGCFENLSNAFIGGARGDAGIYIYIERVSALRFFTWPSEGFDLPSFYPYRRALAYSDNFLLPALLAKLLYPWVNSEPLVYNLIILGALTLNGYVMYLLAMHVTASIGASLFAGFVFLNCPYFAFHRGHPQLQFGFWIPLTLLTVLRFFDKKTVIRASLIGASITGAFFCSVYYAMYCYLLAGLTLGALYIARPKFWCLRDLGILALGNICWVSLLAPAMGPYLEVRSALGTHPIAILRRHSPPLSAFISAPSVAELWSPLTRHLSSMEGHLFFGFLPLLLALALATRYLIRLCREQGASTEIKWSRRLSLCAFLGVLVGIVRGTYFCFQPGARTLHHLAWIQSETLWILILALLVIIFLKGRGRKAQALEEDEKLGVLLLLVAFFIFATLGLHDGGHVGYRAPELYPLLMKLPGFNALRGLARMGLVAIVIAILLAAMSLARLQNLPLLKSRQRFFLLCIFLLLLSAVELHTRPYFPAPENSPPQIYSEVKNLEPEAGIAALPIESPTRHGREFMNWNSLYALWMREYANPLVNGFSGKIPLFQSTAAVQMDSFPSRKAMSVLGSLVGVRYVITHNQFYKKSAALRQREEVQKLPDEVREIACDKKRNCLYDVHPVIASAELPSLDLLVPWSPEERRVAFEIKAAPEAQGGPWNVYFDVLSRGRVVKVSDTVVINANSDWQNFTVEIPPVKERVTPLVVTGRIAGKAPMLVRNVHLFAATQQAVATETVQ